MWKQFFTEIYYNDDDGFKRCTPTFNRWRFAQTAVGITWNVSLPRETVAFRMSGFVVGCYQRFSPQANNRYIKKWRNLLNILMDARKVRAFHLRVSQCFWNENATKQVYPMLVLRKKLRAFVKTACQRGVLESTFITRYRNKLSY